MRITVIVWQTLIILNAAYKFKSLIAFLIKTLLSFLKNSVPATDWRKFFQSEKQMRSYKVEKILKGSLDSISSPSVKIQIMGEFVDNIQQCFAITPFPPIIWNFTESVRWWDQIQAIYLYLFYFNSKYSVKWPQNFEQQLILEWWVSISKKYGIHFVIQTV